jgi:hypothetical protein
MEMIHMHDRVPAPAGPSDPSEPSLPFHVRQGDVLLIAVEGLPDTAHPLPRDGGRVVLAYGEVTGHAHAIASPAATLLADERERYLRAERDVALEHEEHLPIDLPAGTYRVVIQREYVPAPIAGRSWRQVVD